MRVVRILTSDGKHIATYHNAYALLEDDYLFVFASSVGEDDRKYDWEGNWLACFSGPIISWEETQKEDGT